MFLGLKQKLSFFFFNANTVKVKKNKLKIVHACILVKLGVSWVFQEADVWSTGCIGIVYRLSTPPC